MPSLSYKKQFVPLVESFEKLQTIRAMRRRPFMSGDRLSHFSGLRTAARRRLFDATCTEADDIHIFQSGDIYIVSDGGQILKETIDTRSDLYRFAWADGFRGATKAMVISNFMSFFSETHRFSFKGQLMKWHPPALTIQQYQASAAPAEPIFKEGA